MAMSLFSDLTSWLLPKPRQQVDLRQRAGKRKAGTGDEGLRLKLVQRQRSLAEDMQKLVEALDARIDEVADKLHGTDDRMSAREAKMIEATQDELRLAVRRLEATVKTKRELDRELADWEARKRDR